MKDQIVFPYHNFWVQIYVSFIYNFSHSCFELQAKGIRLAMAGLIQNCCKLFTSLEMSQDDTNKNVLAEFPSSLRYRAENILTNRADKTFFPFTFVSFGLISTENKVEKPLHFLWKFFSWHLLNIVHGRGQDISFEDLNALKTISLIQLATSFNLSSEVASYDAATVFEIDISELKTSQNEMRPFHETFEN